MIEKLENQYLIRKSAFAKICGVTPGAITQALNSRHSDLDKSIKGKFIDANHPAAISYIETNRSKSFIEVIKEYERDIEKEEARTKKKKNKVNNLSKIEEIKPRYDEIDNLDDIDDLEIDINQYPKNLSNNNLVQVPENVVAYLDYTVREIYEQFGSTTKFLHFLKSCQIIATVNEKNLKNAVLEGKLVSRESVEKNFFDVVNSAHLKLLSDGSKNLRGAIKAKVMSGASDADIEIEIEKIMAKFIRPVKPKMKKALKDYQKGAVSLDVQT